MKQLEYILQSISTLEIIGNQLISVSDIQTDSRKISNDMLFVAICGVQTDGHAFIETAIEKGATAIICQTLPATIHAHVTYIQVSDSALACGVALRNFYEIDFNTFKVIGVTGTNGKTTTATLLYTLFTKLGINCGLVSTVCNYIQNERIESTHTTPDIIQLYKLFHAMITAGCSYCFMEVSSHAIHQNRISGISFTGGIFSNITQDHLDYHKTFAEYIRVKKLFFDALPSNAFALTNNDDKNGEVMLQNTKAKKQTYSLKNMSDFRCKILENHFDGMLLQINNTEVWTKFIGDFNAYNLLSVYGTAILLGEKHDKVLEIMSCLTAVEGRTQFYRNGNGVTAVIDYAHTPDALENILTTLKKMCSKGNALITVVGAGGDRDNTKRPIMGKIATQLSNMVIITSDNPRSEDPATIAQQMLAGIDTSTQSQVITILDRKEAIKTACLLAKPNDLILIAGKGHETYQEIQGVKHHFDDKEIIQELFNL